jgi:hypothetical protein
MKRTNIYLDEEQDRLLRRLSIEEGRSFTAIVREALDQYLARRGIQADSRVRDPRRLIPAEEWRTRFDAAVTRLHAGASSDDSDTIEAEIGAARAEVRAERAARRHAKGG